MREEILDIIQNSLELRDEVVIVYVLGSFPRGGGFNEIEVAVYMTEKKYKRVNPPDYQVELSITLQELIGSTLQLPVTIPVNVKLMNSASPSFKYNVSRGLLLFSKDDQIREDFLCQSWQEYFDFQYVSKTYLKEVLNGGF